MGFLDKLANILIPQPEPEKENDNGNNVPATQPAEVKEEVRTTLKNQHLLNDISKQFKTDLENESLGNRMLFPMAFDIFMHPTDYDQRKPSFQLILNEIVSALYKIIREYSSQYSDYTPVSKKWYFHFYPYEGNLVDDGMYEGNEDMVMTEAQKEAFTIKRFYPIILAQLYTEDIDMGNTNVTSERNVTVSVVVNNTNIGQGGSINFSALKKVDALDEGVYTLPFDMEPPTQTGPVTDPPDSYGKLVYQDKGNNYTYKITDTYITISGCNDTRNMRQIFKLNSPDVKNDHVLIRFNTDTGRFEIAATAPTRLNGRALDLSASSSIKWAPLANNSNIFINESVSVKFQRS
ncbi:MAG: hypothetical protein MJZ74_04350 [Muribaculaceae bacterium]|nr:hypothetical protein [Muribaculaceae bacterium]